MKESSIQKRIMLEVGNDRDLHVDSNPSGFAHHASGGGNPYGWGIEHRGGSDLILCVKQCCHVCHAQVLPAMVFWEVKSATGRQRKEQIAFEQRLHHELGAPYVLVRSPEQARAWIDEYRRKHG